jgi:hypothetical protein
MTSKDVQGTAGITLETAITELGILIEDADDFVTSELESNWADAERYYKGGTDLEEYEGRSNVVKTEVRDAIRNTLPSVMRTLLHARKPVDYFPTSIQHAAWVEQQAEYVTQLFWETDGYYQLYNALVEALKLKIGVLKAAWEPNPKPVFNRYTNVSFEFVESLLADDTFEVEDYEVTDTQLGGVTLYNVEGYRVHENGAIIQEAVPNYEFFISRNVNSIEQAKARGVHGQKGIVSVSEALEMGLPDGTDWLALDAEDPEQSDKTSSSMARRGYAKQGENDPSSVDVLRHQFLLTEAYVEYDLKGEGQTQLYKFYLGGTSYTYLHHEEVEDSPFSLIIPNPIPFTVYGDSMADLTMNEQDTSTSLLRAMIDNAHASNGAKIAADPTKTNFDDLMNPAINAPIRKRAGDTIQTIQIPFTGQGNLAALQYLDQDVQNKVGVTKAAQGLDPDAMQSTDKNAVLNTIMTGQGQTELMVRNIIETGLIRHFKLLLRLSIRHHSPIRLMKTKGKVIPINIQMFDPDAVAVPAVGLGTASPMQKQAALTFIYNEQKQVMDKYGPNNPFTSYSQIYNTLEDLMEANSIYNVGRYFNIVTPQIEEQWAKAQQEQAQLAQEQAQKSQPMDPSKAFITVEAQKAELKRLDIAAISQREAQKLSFEATKAAEELDIKRDQLVLERAVKLAEVGQQARELEIKKEQATNARIPTASNTGSKKSA